MILPRLKRKYLPTELSRSFIWAVKFFSFRRVLNEVLVRAFCFISCEAAKSKTRSLILDVSTFASGLMDPVLLGAFPAAATRIQISDQISYIFLSGVPGPEVSQLFRKI